QAIVSLSRRNASFGQAFHLFNPFTVSISDLVSWINDFGYPLRAVTYDAWLEDLKQTAEQSASNALADLVPLFPKRKAEEKQQAQLPRVIFDNRSALVGLSGTPISCSSVDAQLLHTYLSYFVQSGFLHAPQSV